MKDLRRHLFLFATGISLLAVSLFWMSCSSAQKRNDRDGQTKIHICSWMCSDLIGQRTTLQNAGLSCGQNATLNLRRLDSWYQAMERRAWSLYHRPKDEATMKERRQFLKTYVEHAQPILSYDISYLAFSEELALTVLFWLNEQGEALTVKTWRRWKRRLPSETFRSDELRACMLALEHRLQSQ